MEVYVPQGNFGQKNRRFRVAVSAGKKWQFASVQIGNIPKGRMVRYPLFFNSFFVACNFNETFSNDNNL